MGKTSYQNISDLITELNEKLQKLNNGSLEIEQVEPMVDNAKELYERLVVLRYKVYEKFGEPQSEEETSFDFSGITEVEETKIEEKPVAEEVEEVVEKEVVVEADELVEETEEIEETIEEIEVVKEEPSEEPMQAGFDFSGAIEEPRKEAPEEIPASESSLHEKLTNDDDELSLRKKLQNTPVTDIKSEISLARRFEYISILFEEDKDAYDNAISEFNSCSGVEEARTKLNNYSQKYNWDLENKAIVKFVELVERRYL